MLALLVLAVVASASANPLEKKILPIYEQPLSYKGLDAGMALRSWCLDDCHYHVLDKPVFILMKSADNKYDIHYSPQGLNALGKSPVTAHIKDYLMSDKKVAMITPLAKFPFELFPGVTDLDVMDINTPEHSHTLKNFYKEAPVMMIFSEQEFQQFNEKKGLTHLADMAIDTQGFSLAKDLAQFRNSNPASPRSWNDVPQWTGVSVPHSGRQLWTEVPASAPVFASGLPVGYSGSVIPVGAAQDLSVQKVLVPKWTGIF